MDIYLGVTQGFRSQLCQSLALQLQQAAEFNSGNVCCVTIVALVLRHSACMHAKSLQSCPTLCDPVDCSPPGLSIRGILQARILEWVATSFSSRASRPRDRTRVSCGSCTVGGFFIAEPPGKPLRSYVYCSVLLDSLRPHGFSPQAPLSTEFSPARILE